MVTRNGRGRLENTAMAASGEGGGHQKNGMRWKWLDGWQILQVKHRPLTETATKMDLGAWTCGCHRNYPSINLKLNQWMQKNAQGKELGWF